MITRICQSVFPVFLLVCCISLGAVSAFASVHDTRNGKEDYTSLYKL